MDLIITEEENKACLRIVERLMKLDPDPKSHEGMLLNGLVNEIKKFEEKTYG